MADGEQDGPSPEGETGAGGEQPTVDIHHKHKPIHGWREFLKEYGIIVLGVLTALAAEQTVEAIHWHGEVVEAREALKVELDHDLGALDFFIAQGPCLARRLDEVDAWIAAARAGRPTRLARQFPTVESYSLNSSVWDITKAGQTAAHMPLADKIAYASFYDGLAAWTALRNSEGAAIRDLKDVDLTAAPAPGSLPHVAGAVRQIRTAEALWPIQRQNSAAEAERLGLAPDRLAHYHPEVARELCESLRTPDPSPARSR